MDNFTDDKDFMETIVARTQKPCRGRCLAASAPAWNVVCPPYVLRIAAATQPRSHTMSITSKPADSRSEQLKEQEKTAADNTSQGYGSTVKSRFISAKPDGNTQGGPGTNNDQARSPAPTASTRKP
jgi:hypothetical protein